MLLLSKLKRKFKCVLRFHPQPVSNKIVTFGQLHVSYKQGGEGADLINQQEVITMTLPSGCSIEN